MSFDAQLAAAEITENVMIQMSTRFKIKIAACDCNPTYDSFSTHISLSIETRST